MKPLRRLAALVIPLLLLVALAACGATATPTPTPEPLFPLTIEDSSGHAVTFTAPPQRIVSLSPAQTEIFFVLGVGDRVVGRDRFSDHPPEAQAIPTVGDAFSLDLERIAALQPDLAYIDFETPRAALQGLGIPVLYLDPPQKVEGVLENILLLGRLLDRQPQAQALVTDLRQQIQAVEARIQDMGEGPRVYYELDAGLFTAGPSTFIGDLLARLKAQNIAAAAKGPYPQLSNEFLVEQDPEVILLADSAAYGNGEETPETVAARPGWAGITAVREGRVHPAEADVVSRPGPRIGQGLRHLAQLLYPELFD